MTEDPDSLTPIERRGALFFKRDDLFCFKGEAGANGGKVRAMLRLLKGARGVVTCGDRLSTQLPRAALTAKLLGLPCRLHTATGEFTPGMVQAKEYGAEIVQHKAGYLNVVKKRARDDAAALGWTEVPWGCECTANIRATAEQVANIPTDAQRLVVCVGSGMTLAGVLQGFEQLGPTLPVLGVAIGNPSWSARLANWGPVWPIPTAVKTSPLQYHDPAPTTAIEGVELDPHYEAKCIPFLRPGDCLWVVGIRPA